MIHRARPHPLSFTLGGALASAGSSCSSPTGGNPSVAHRPARLAAPCESTRLRTILHPILFVFEKPPKYDASQPAQSQIWNCNFWFDCYVDCGGAQEVEWIETYCEDENGNPVHHSYTTTGYCCYSW